MGNYRNIETALQALSRGLPQAARTLCQLATRGESEAIRLRAAEAMLKALVALEQHAELRQRLEALEAVLNEKGAWHR